MDFKEAAAYIDAEIRREERVMKARDTESRSRLAVAKAQLDYTRAAHKEAKDTLSDLDYDLTAECDECYRQPEDCECVCAKCENYKTECECEPLCGSDEWPCQSCDRPDCDCDACLECNSCGLPGYDCECCEHCNKTPCACCQKLFCKSQHHCHCPPERYDLSANILSDQQWRLACLAATQKSRSMQLVAAHVGVTRQRLYKAAREDKYWRHEFWNEWYKPSELMARRLIGVAEAQYMDGKVRIAAAVAYAKYYADGGVAVADEAYELQAARIAEAELAQEQAAEAMSTPVTKPTCLICESPSGCVCQNQED